MRKMKKTILISMILFHVIAVPGWAGTIVVWGNDSYGQVDDTPPGDDWVDVSAGGCHIMALREDGIVVAWGDNWFGQCDIPEGTKAVAISAGETFSLWLKSDGSVGGCGDDTLGQISDLPTGTNIAAIAAGGYDSLWLNKDGTMGACGMNSFGQVSDTPSGNNFIAIAGGLEHNLALRDDDIVVGWGCDTAGQVTGLPTSDDIAAMSAGWGHSVWKKTDGSVDGCGDDSDKQISDLPTGFDTEEIDAGGKHTCWRKSDGSLGCCGWDVDGTVSDTPKDNNFMRISAGGYNNAAIKDSGAENEPPVADPGGPYNGTVGEFIFLDGSKSKDSDGTIDSYYWVLGDGQIYTDSLPQAFHVYAVEGKYKVTLTVTDDDGATGEASTEVVISGNNTIRPFVWVDPEKLNLGRDDGNVKATIFGSEDCDVRKVDPGSIFLEGVPANRSNIEDVGGPFDQPDNHIPDGCEDLKSQFSFSDLKQTEKFDGLSDGDIVVVRLNGKLYNEYGGNPIEGQDEIVIKNKDEGRTIDDFESYSNELPIKEVWTDGVGSPDNPGNGTGSTLNLDSWGPNQFVSFSYDNSVWPYFSEISKILDPSQNWEKYGTYIEVEVIGMNGSTGSVSYDPEKETYTVIGSGDDIWDRSDEFYYVYKKLDGDGSITAGVPTYGSHNSWSKAGIMIRNTLDADSQHATLSTTPNDNVNVVTRENEGDKSQRIRIQIDEAQPRFYRIGRVGELFWVEQSDDLNNNWSPVKSPNGDVIGPFSIPMNKEVYIGMIVMSGNENATIEVKFTDVSTTGEVSPAGPFRTSEDVGNPHNDPARFCLKVEDSQGNSAVVNHPDDPTAVQVKDWSSWSTPLTVFSDQGVNLTEINKIIFVIGDLDNLDPGGSGAVYLDNIRVYSP